MPELIADLLCALLLAITSVLLRPQLLPRVRAAHGWRLFASTFVLAFLVGTFLTPLGYAVWDAAALVGALFIGIGLAALLTRRGRAPEDQPAVPAAPRPQAALWVTFSYLWFAPLFLALVGLRLLAA